MASAGLLLAAVGRCLLGCPFGPTGATGAPNVVALCSDASKDGLGRDGRRDRVLHAELKLFAENPALRARAPRESRTGLIEAHSEQLLRAALEEIRGLGIVRCVVHRSFPNGRRSPLTLTLEKVPLVPRFSLAKILSMPSYASPS